MASPTIDGQLPYPPTPDSPVELCRSGRTAHLASLPEGGSAADSSPDQLPHLTLQARPILVSPLGAGNIADSFADLMKPLSRQRRRGMIAQLSVGFYDGWRPTRDEIADLVAVELGTMTVDDHLERQRCRTRDQLDRAVRAAWRAPTRIVPPSVD